MNQPCSASTMLHFRYAAASTHRASPTWYVPSSKQLVSSNLLEAVRPESPHSHATNSHRTHTLNTSCTGNHTMRCYLPIPATIGPVSQITQTGLRALSTASSVSAHRSSLLLQVLFAPSAFWESHSFPWLFTWCSSISGTETNNQLCNAIIFWPNALTALEW